VRGDSPPDTAKVALNYQGGWRSTLTLYLTGLDIEEKAALVERALWAGIPGGRDAFDDAEVALLRTDKPDPATNAEAMAQLRITVKHSDERAVGRAFSARVTELALASYPGMFGDGLVGGARAYGVYWPTTVPAALVSQQIFIGGERTVVQPALPPEPPVVAEVPAVAVAPAPVSGAPARGATTRAPLGRVAGGATVRAPLGRVAGARSGDKGGNANLGVWARTDAAYAWLAGFLTAGRLKELLPETAPLPVERYELPNLRALNFVVVGLLGEGVAASTRLDPQAKSLGEWLRARVVDVPHELLGS
jgi:hypothetical protein